MKIVFILMIMIVVCVLVGWLYGTDWYREGLRYIQDRFRYLWYMIIYKGQIPMIDLSNDTVM